MKKKKFCINFGMWNFQIKRVYKMFPKEEAKKNYNKTNLVSNAEVLLIGGV